jgi:primosomal protein N'
VPAPRCTHDISYEDAEGQERCHDCGEPVHETV